MIDKNDTQLEWAKKDLSYRMAPKIGIQEVEKSASSKRIFESDRVFWSSGYEAFRQGYLQLCWELEKSVKDFPKPFKGTLVVKNDCTDDFELFMRAELWVEKESRGGVLLV